MTTAQIIDLIYQGVPVLLVVGGVLILIGTWPPTWPPTASAPVAPR